MNSGPAPEKLLAELLAEVLSLGASDLHVSVGRLPIVRVDGALRALEGRPPLSMDDVTSMVQVVMGIDRSPLFFTERREVDIAYDPAGSELRFRVNVFWSRGEPTIVFRSIPRVIRTIRDLNLPETLLRFTEPRQGFILLAAPSGHGKTTTMATLVDHINHTRSDHIITIEDPVEYVFTEVRSLIHQREVGSDARSFPAAIRAALREDPNVVVIGEMRDLETIATALTVSETGHLVFGTIHTNDAAQTIDRILDAFPAERQAEVRVQLAATLTGIVSQRLVPRASGGRIPIVEILAATPAVRNLIREGETAQIPGLIQTGAEYGMISLERSVAELLRRGEVTPDSIRPYLPTLPPP
ncbi:MAG: twitching motility protein PilT [Parcubacteria group bacterium Gr01-1014_38]|nr:MAG: twitching motility protein PilT [Parcubacteria group bacterium Gr01-1014_38]